MSENLLQFIWLHRLYKTEQPLRTTEGDQLIVLHPGQLNTNAGPDFLEAKLKIGQTLWAGNIELHLKSSDWTKHEHQANESYSRLIMHVVYEDDASIKTKDQSEFPTLELKPYIDRKLLQNYAQLMQDVPFIPCQEAVKEIRDITIRQQMTRMLAERLEEKTRHIHDLLQRYKNSWQEVFYIQLARGFGLHINQDTFEQLAIDTPMQLLAKHKFHPYQIEALLFGQAGFLEDYFDELYPVTLQKEYEYLKNLYSLQPGEKHRWKFLRLRPANFPTIRIAQFAQLILQSNHLFSKIIEAQTMKELVQLFSVTVSDYWLEHYNFQEKSAERNKTLGTSFIHSLIINAVIPMLFIYGKLQGKESICEKAIKFLESLPAERNSIINQWESAGIRAANAADSQALLQLKNVYCEKKRCLECSIGYALLRRE